MPRSGSHSKKNRDKIRQAAAAMVDGHPAPTPAGNPFQELAAQPTQSEPFQGDEEEPHQEQPEEEDESAAEAYSTGRGAAAEEGNDDILSAEQPVESSGEASGLAEDLLAAPSALPAQDPVRVETAACLRRCRLGGTTPPAWVLELVLPGSTKPVGGPTERQIGELITSMTNIEKAMVSKLTAVRGRGRSVAFDTTSYGPSDRRGRSASADNSRACKTKVASGKPCDYPMCRHRNSHSRPECRLAKSHEEKGWKVSRTDD